MADANQHKLNFINQRNEPHHEREHVKISDKSQVSELQAKYTRNGIHLKKLKIRDKCTQSGLRCFISLLSTKSRVFLPTDLIRFTNTSRSPTLVPKWLTFRGLQWPHIFNSNTFEVSVHKARNSNETTRCCIFLENIKRPNLHRYFFLQNLPSTILFAKHLLFCSNYTFKPTNPAPDSPNLP